MQKPNGCKVAQQRTEEEVKAVLKWITEKDSPVAIMYGGTPELEEDFRFADNEKEYTIDEILELYKSTKA